MEGKKETPTGLLDRPQGNMIEEQDKDTPKLTNRQKKLVDLLRTGKYSAADISIRLGYCDPRSHIKRLISKCVWVQSAWVEKADTRYKVYWLEG